MKGLIMEMRMVIRGVAPLLQHRYRVKETDKTKNTYDPEVEAESKSYKDDEGYYVPSEQLEASIREASKAFKRKGKSSYKETILTGVRCREEKLRIPKYDSVDTRPVVIQKNRVLSSRPRWDSWSLSCTLEFDEDQISPTTLKEIVAEAGKVKGLGDYRPKFGRFKIEEPAHVSNA